MYKTDQVIQFQHAVENISERYIVKMIIVNIVTTRDTPQFAYQG